MKPRTLVHVLWGVAFCLLGCGDDDMGGESPQATMGDSDAASAASGGEGGPCPEEDGAVTITLEWPDRTRVVRGSQGPDGRDDALSIASACDVFAYDDGYTLSARIRFADPIVTGQFDAATPRGENASLGAVATIRATFQEFNVSAHLISTGEVGPVEGTDEWEAWYANPLLLDEAPPSFSDDFEVEITSIDPDGGYHGSMRLTYHPVFKAPAWEPDPSRDPLVVTFEF